MIQRNSNDVYRSNSPHAICYDQDASTKRVWATPSDLGLTTNQGSERWPSSASLIVHTGDGVSQLDIREENILTKSDGARQRKSGAISTTFATATSSVASGAKYLLDGSSETNESQGTSSGCKTATSFKSTESTEESLHFHESPERSTVDINSGSKEFTSFESLESSGNSSNFPRSSDLSKWDVTTANERPLARGPIKAPGISLVSQHPEITKHLSEKSGTGPTLSTMTKTSPLYKLYERPKRQADMAVPNPFASPSLVEICTGKSGQPPSRDESESDVPKVLDEDMPMPNPFNSPSLANLLKSRPKGATTQQAVKQTSPDKIQSKRAVEVGSPIQADPRLNASIQETHDLNSPTRKHVSKTVRSAETKPSVKAGRKTPESVEEYRSFGPIQGSIARPKAVVHSESHVPRAEAYVSSKKDSRSPDQSSHWEFPYSSQKPKLQTPIAGQAGANNADGPSRSSTCGDGLTLASKEDILNQSASERPKKVEPSTKMKAALKVVNDLIEKSPTLSDIGQTAKAANAIIQREWFQISSTPSADPHIVEDYLDHFEEMSSTLLTYVVNMADKAGNTAMHYALSQGNFDVVSILLDSKVCNINLPNAAGYTAVMLVSLAQIRSDTHRCVLQRFLADADVNVRAQQHGQTALMLAVSHNRLDMVQLLIEGGADLNIQDDDGSTALMCAAEHGHAAIVQFLINQPDTDLNIKDVDGLTALDIALDAGHKDVGILLYAHKHFSRNNSPYSSLRGRRSKSATPTTRTASTPPPRTPVSPLPVRALPRHSHD